jgi:predicted tellurium resistance membrane protein TerC
MEAFLSPEGLISLLTLTVLEIVLGIDNIIFISILVGRYDPVTQKRARTIGLSLAVILRVVFLFFASWIAGLKDPLFTITSFGFSGRDLIMLAGGLFLLAKATTELHSKLEGAEHDDPRARTSSFASLITQIVVLDIVFSIDSVITAVGLASNLWIMVTAVLISVAVMQLSAGAISSFIEKHPTIKILALAFLLMVGLVLVVEGFHIHIPRGYVYAAMAFSIGVEFLNMRYRRKAEKPVELRLPDYHQD